MQTIVDNNTGDTEKRRVGRPTAYKNNMKALHDVVDLIASQDYSEGWEKRILSCTDLAAHPDMKLGSSAISKNGFPAYWRDQYESCDWQRGKGLIIELEGYLMERARIEYENRQEDGTQ